MTPPMNMVSMGTCTRPWACKMELAISIRQTNSDARPSTESSEPPSSLS